MNREELVVKELNQRNYKTGVEIGTFKGYFAQHILRNWNGTLYMVDVWRELEKKEYTDISNRTTEDNVWFEAMKAIDGFEDRALMLRMKSNQASKLFADDSLDFIYIDANHKYDAVKEDIELWWPKLKSGGMLAGHDYLKLDWSTTPKAENGMDVHIYDAPTSHYVGLFGVNPAVDEFAKNKQYEVFQTDEWYGTWYLFKK
jgi:hypothetical protein